MTNEFRIHVQLRSRYRAFDTTGQLPFSVVFGLCRLSKLDTDSRPILIETAGSVFDVPYALAHGLLTIHEEQPGETTQQTEVDVSKMGNVDPSDSEYISVPSPVNRTKGWTNNLTVHLSHIAFHGALASILKPGKRYRIKLASKNLGVSKWTYSDETRFSEKNSETEKLVNSYSHGHAEFKVVDNLAFPPKVEMRMRMVGHTSLEVTAENTGVETITVQPRGHQRFIVPWGPMRPEPAIRNTSPRIIDKSTQDRAPTSSLMVVDATTGEIVRGGPKPDVCQLTSGNADLRPRVEELMVLEPRTPVTNMFDIGRKLEGLQDGQYKIRVYPTGCRWWRGKVENEDGEDGKVPSRLWKGLTVPLMLESKDELEVIIKDGKVDGSL